MAPASPMKILAGLKLCGRKPTQTATTITATSGPMFEPSRSPGLEQTVRVEEERRARDDHDADRETVEAVDEVHRVGEHHDGEHRDEGSDVR